MDYNELSDFEINQLVADNFGMLTQEIDDDNSLGMTTEYHEKYPNVVWVAHLDCSTGMQCEPWWQFDPCNNPSDAWPIIEEIWGMLMSLTFYDYSVGLGAVQTTIWEARTHMYGGNKLRVAMIVYLIMKERI